LTQGVEAVKKSLEEQKHFTQGRKAAEGQRKQSAYGTSGYHHGGVNAGGD
jgi:hypothetical protein